MSTHWRRLPLRLGFALWAVLLLGVAAACTNGDDEETPTSPSTGSPTSTTGATGTPDAVGTGTPEATSVATTAPTSVATTGPTTVPTEPPDTTAPSGNIVVALSALGPDNYELHQLSWPWNDRNQYLGIYDTIFYDDRTAGATDLIQPSVASEWQMTADALILTIRDDIPWHDAQYGNLTVEDILFSFERGSSEGTVWTRAEALTTNFKVDEIAATGPNEITMPWNQQDLRWRSVPRDLTLQSKAMFDAIGAEQMNLTPMGSGPYRVISHASDDHISLEAVPNHWRETAHVQFIDVLEVPEEAIRTGMLANGEADVVQMGMSSIADVLNVEGAKTMIGPLTGSSGAQVVPTGQYYQTEDEEGNPTGRTPLTQLPWVGETPEGGLKVRRAMAMSIDRGAIVDTILEGLGDEHYLWNLGPGHPRWTDEMQQNWGIPFDPDAAQTLLDEAGYGDGFDFEFFIPSGLSSTLEQVCQSMVPMFQAIGLNPTVDTSAYSSVRPRMLARTMDMVWCWQESGWNVDPDGPLYRFSTRAVWNPGIEYEEPLDFETRILGVTDPEEGWDIILNEWLPWFDENLPSFQTVSFTAPMGVGPRVESWDMRLHSDRWPRDPWLIQLN